MIQIIRQFIKRCVCQFQAMLITWKVNYKMRRAPENRVSSSHNTTLKKNKLKQKIKDIVMEQERIELDLFKDVTIPDLRDKDAIKKGGRAAAAAAAAAAAQLAEIAASTLVNGAPPTAGAAPSTGEGRRLQKAVLTLTNLKDIQTMFSYEIESDVLEKTFFYSKIP